MPFFGAGESTYDSSQNIQLTSLNQRLSTIEAYNAGNRLGVLEAVNSASRLGVLEALDAGARLTALESVPAPTLTSLGGEPAGAETRAKTYTDQKVAAIVMPTLTSLGGEPAGAETRAKTYTDQQIVGVYPTRLEHFYGYGARAYNGTQDKTFSYTVNTSYEFGRYASISSPAQNDIYEVSFLLKTGSYNLTLLYDKGTTRGIASIYFDDALLGAIDCYNASTVAVNRSSYTITVPASGTHTIKIKILSKNASSTGYAFNCSGIFASPVVQVSTVRVNCGGNAYTDSLGNQWLADTYFSGGSNYDIESYIGPFTVTGTNDQALYKFERSAEPGTFTYTIPINSGTYTINLLFCENNKTASGQRVGTVALNGSNILTNFDVYAQAGGQHKALIKSFTNQSLTSFALTITNTLINGIELIRTA